VGFGESPTRSNVPGRFIVIEGIDASGKSTQVALLGNRLGAVVTREPGGTAAGEQIRSLLLRPDPTVAISHRTEALLMAAARAQHVAEVVEPALSTGQTVVCDRYIASSIAYQGYGRELDPSEVQKISEWASDHRWPDLTILVRVPVEVALERLRTSRGAEGIDRLEAAGEAFLTRVADGFDALAATQVGGPWIVVDGLGTIDAVADEIERRTRHALML
jgi:dTMP kinase